jgi:hypothetical protein
MMCELHRKPVCSSKPVKVIDNKKTSLRPGPNVIKLFTAVIYEFSHKARVFVRTGWKSLAIIKHSSLSRKSVIYVIVRNLPIFVIS